MLRIAFLFFLFFVSQNAFSQNIWAGYEHLFMPVQTYVIHQTPSEINIDGKAHELVWSETEWTNYFEDIEGDKKPNPTYKTRCKMLWDNENLYIYAELEEPHIWAYYDKMDMIVFHENDFEVFIDPDRSTHNYYEFEVNAQNTLFDLFLPKPYRNSGQANIGWNAQGFKNAVFIDGTLNNPTDIDKMWTVEMAIPFSSLICDNEFVQPGIGKTWKMGFSRVQWQTEIVNGKYLKKKDSSTNKDLPENNWVWSPQGLINMHFPERWGMVQFAGANNKNKEQKFEFPTEEKLNNYLWLIYYKQEQFKKENSVYAKSLSELEIPESAKVDNITFNLKLETDARKYTAILETETGIKLSINQSGLFQILNL